MCEGMKIDGMLLLLPIRDGFFYIFVCREKGELLLFIVPSVGVCTDFETRGIGYIGRHKLLKYTKNPQEDLKPLYRLLTHFNR